MPFSLLIGVLTLVPALAAILIAGLGVARRALAPVVFVLCALGALAPIICLLILAPYLGSGEPLRVTLFGGSLAANAWFSAVYRADAVGVYAGLGLTILVVPLLLWMAWKGRITPSALAVKMKLKPAEAALVVPAVPETETESETAAPVEAYGETDAEPAEAEAVDESVAPAPRPLLPMRSWAGVALTLAAESAALTVLFADNILWLALAWLVLAALIWGLGELDAEAVDRAGLAFMLVGPVLWGVVMLLGASAAKSPTFFDLMGRGAYSPVQVIALALVIALAGGGYPFLVWVRRRAALATPAGLGALLLVSLPMALFVAARTYGAAQDARGQWAEIGQAAPPVYSGIAWAILGAVTVGVCGLLALERRDHRTLLAYLAVAQIGWGMLALSTGDPVGLAGVALLLAGSVFGLGAMLAALFAGATLTDDEEPDGSGPRAFGARFSPASLFAWCVGGVSLIGVPLFGGFAARQLTSAAALHLGNLTVPLVGVAWAGDALLALALLRATAPAFTQLTADSGEEDEGENESGEEETLTEVAEVATGAKADDRDVLNADDEDVTEEDAGDGDFEDDEEETEDEDEEDGDEAEVKPGIRDRRAPLGDIRALPALIFGLLAVALGIAPHLLLGFFGGTLAVSTLAPIHAVDRALRSTQVGYAAGFGQWLPGIAWGALVVLALIFTFTRSDSLRVARLPQQASDQEPAEIKSESLEHVEQAPELSGLPEPVETWQDLDSIFDSPFTLPAGAWLLGGAGAESAEEDEAANEKTAEVALEEPEVPEELDELEEPEETTEPEAVVEASETPEVPETPAPEEPESEEPVVAAPTASAEAATDKAEESDDTSPVESSQETPDDTGIATDNPDNATQPVAVTPDAKPTASTSSTRTDDSAAAKPAAGDAPTRKAKAATPSSRPKSTTKPAPGKANAPAAAKGGKPGNRSGNKKQSGGRP